MGIFGRDNAFDLAILSDIADGDEDEPETKAAREILGVFHKDNTISEIKKTATAANSPLVSLLGTQGSRNEAH